MSDVLEAELSDGTKIRGPAAVVMSAVWMDRQRRYGNNSPPPKSGEGSIEDLDALLESQGLPEDYAPEFVEEANKRLTGLLERRKPFKTAIALKVWAGKEVPSRKDGKPNPEYHKVWGHVGDVIDAYAAEHGLEVVRFRAGRGSVIRLDEPEEPSDDPNDGADLDSAAQGGHQHERDEDEDPFGLQDGM